MRYSIYFQILTIHLYVLLSKLDLLLTFDNIHVCMILLGQIGQCKSSVHQRTTHCYW